MNITYFGFLKYVTNHSTLKLLRRYLFLSQMAHAHVVTLSHDILISSYFNVLT